VIRGDDMATSIGGDAAPERGKGGENTSLVDANLAWPKNKIKIQTVDSAVINER
jgi:hypothetical protein